MGAIVSIKLQTSDPNYEENIRTLAGELESACGEKVYVDVGIVDRRGAPNVIQVDKILDQERSKIRGV